MVRKFDFMKLSPKICTVMSVRLWMYAYEYLYAYECTVMPKSVQLCPKSVRLCPKVYGYDLYAYDQKVYAYDTDVYGYVFKKVYACERKKCTLMWEEVYGYESMI